MNAEMNQQTKTISVNKPNETTHFTHLGQRISSSLCLFDMLWDLIRVNLTAWNIYHIGRNLTLAFYHAIGIAIKAYTVGYIGNLS